MALFRCMNKTGGGGGTVADITLINGTTLSPNPFTYETTTDYTGAVLEISRASTDPAAANPTITISIGSIATKSITLAKGGSTELYAFNVPSGTTVTINRTSGSTGQNAVLTAVLHTVT